ncbi:hypothetical protein H6F69_13270 [Leptolyngbya sp. FACHB-1624]|nr:hypothetical protein [Leptolyngbya sp. FACHB-1624]
MTYFDGIFYYCIESDTGFCRVEDRWDRLEVCTEDSLQEALAVTGSSFDDLMPA